MQATWVFNFMHAFFCFHVCCKFHPSFCCPKYTFGKQNFTQHFSHIPLSVDKHLLTVEFWEKTFHASLHGNQEEINFCNFSRCFLLISGCLSPTQACKHLVQIPSTNTTTSKLNNTDITSNFKHARDGKGTDAKFWKITHAKNDWCFSSKHGILIRVMQPPNTHTQHLCPIYIIQQVMNP